MATVTYINNVSKTAHMLLYALSKKFDYAEILRYDYHTRLGIRVRRGGMKYLLDITDLKDTISIPRAVEALSLGFSQEKDRLYGVFGI